MKDREKYIIVVEGQMIEVTPEVYEVYYKGRRKEQYIMHDLKVGRSRINPETGEKEYLPSREDSYDRLRDVEQQFADPGMDVEGQVDYGGEVACGIEIFNTGRNRVDPEIIL